MLVIRIAILLAAATFACARAADRFQKADAPRADPAGEYFKISQQRLVLRSPGECLPIGLRIPRLVLDSEEIAGQAAQPPGDLVARLQSGSTVECTLPAVVLSDSSRLVWKLFLRWSPNQRVLRKWAALAIQGTGRTRVMKEVVFDQWKAAGDGVSIEARQPIFQSPQSYPVFLRGFFAGVEFPVATTVANADLARISHAPGLRMTPGRWYQTRKAVYGIASSGGERAAFESYILANSPGELKPFIGWNTFWGLVYPPNEKGLLEELKSFETNLFRPHGVSLDAFILDWQWSDPQSIWEMNRQRFPRGFEEVSAACRRMNARLGLWTSPCAMYPPALDGEWARKNGYETFLPSPGYRILCQGGPRYQTRFRERVLDLYKSYGLGYSKFDGYVFTCPESNHGHEPGALSADACAEGMAETMRAMHAAFPYAWINPTCFGGLTSPWWLFYANSVTGNFGDDTVWGRVPAPIYRESHVTARDYHNLQGISYNPLPIARTDVFGSLSNNDPGSIANDAVVTWLRGTMHVSVDLDPGLLEADGWTTIADGITWMRKNAHVLRNTRALLPASWQNGRVPKVDYYYAPAPREPYGYAHFNDESGLVMLRNPWITHQVYSLKLAAECGLAPTAARLSAVGLYPENRLYGTALRFGDTLQVPLEPYETLVLEIAPLPAPAGIPEVRASAKSFIRSDLSRLETNRVRFEGPAEKFGDDWLSPMAGSAASMWLRLAGNIEIDAPQAELLVLCEEKSEEVNPLGSAWINGKKVLPIITGPHVGFNADGHRVPEHWQFLRYPLAHGKNRAVLELLTRTEEPRISVWVWAFKPGEVRGSKYRNSFPQPDRISLDSARLMPETGIKASSLRTVRMRWPIEKIDGVYLDSRKPASATGEIHRNSSAGRRPMFVAGERFNRGIGMVAPQQAVYDLGGQFRRFQSLVGVDTMYMYSRSDLVFEVWADGRKLWDSGVMRRSDRARRVDVDIAGAQTLTLAVRNVAPRSMTSEMKWADWGDARVLRSVLKPTDESAPTDPFSHLLIGPGGPSRVGSDRTTNGAKP